uniref:Uncharacterized protein n=1 Tax=Tetraselmis sp. GSL018 TaxID=582737 RepID=A0A061SEB4_9CHLO|mmetsp:Transcript_24147/g.57522  ORF Transcript_24147/g.57522 Transcript_24147/m.57522 type:complete len:252 (-) Transcript_24147:580-1335(-)
MLRQKADLTEVREALSCKANTAAVERLFERVERQERGGKDMASALDRIWEDLRAKAGSGQLGALLDAKANVDDVNHALAEVSSQLEQKASASALDELQRAQWQAASSPLLSNDNCIGRWIWRSGRTKAGGAVPWNVQSVNCDPQNLKWEKDRSSIVVVSAGMYEVMLGFFSNRKPTVQLHVNGEPVLAAVSTSESVLNRSTGHLATLGRYASGNTAGLSLVDFLLLPQRAKITVTYSGDEAGEGFISLKRL